MGESLSSARAASPALASKACDYYDVWRLLKEKADHFDRQTARGVLTAKCHHKGLTTPAVADVLRPTLLDTAAAYWSQELIGQVPGGELPDWGAVTADLCPLLKNFLGQ